MVVALECSTFSTLMDAAAFEKLGQPDWLQQPPGVVSICILVASWRCRQEQGMSLLLPCWGFCSVSESAKESLEPLECRSAIRPVLRE